MPIPAIGQPFQRVGIAVYLGDERKLSSMLDVAQEQLSKEQYKQKEWYDKQSRVQEFQENDEVLVLLPTSSSKLTASW